MGLLGSLFGGGGSSGYKSKNIGEYEEGARQSIYNRAGVKKIKNPAYTAWQQQPTGYASSNGVYEGNLKQPGNQFQRGKAPSEYTYDYSSVGAPVSSETANQPYNADYSQVGSLTDKLSNPTKLKQTYSTGYSPTAYNPYQFNFGNDDVINEATALQYGLGSKDVNRQSQGALEQQRQAIGTRRPGLLLRASEGNQRSAGENLALLNSNLRSQALQQKLSLGQAQQQAQAAENFGTSQFSDAQQRVLADEMYKAYGSRADLERGNVDNSMKGQQAGIDALLNKINLKKGVTESERDYQDRALDYLMDMYKSSAGINAKTAETKATKRGQTLGALGTLGKIAAAPATGGASLAL